MFRLPLALCVLAVVGLSKDPTLQFKTESGESCAINYKGGLLSTDCRMGTGFADNSLRTDFNKLRADVDQIRADFGDLPARVKVLEDHGHLGDNPTQFPTSKPTKAPTASPTSVKDSCNELWHPNAVDGKYLIGDPHASFEVDCVFKNGRGWTALSFEATQGSYSGQKWIVAGGYHTDNPWWKCKDNMGSVYDFISDNDTGGSNGGGRVAAKNVKSFDAINKFGTHGPDTKEATKLRYYQPSTGNYYSDAQMNHIRKHTD